ncbi:AbrB/MazE/SpoVT family DNA-binding domain-containing protein [Desulfovibrio sp.]|uniref:AbrB/MazE/SpoVT family DNA-binding domain-containing protein n=1 Tax=Desulfovibrio sp. TaxID=885 RepID=UPI0019C766FF|nr:AbrB/MazE/SpoVT family DNA-binding domain-containing protein [Desulfovibrio sp.]MBD5626228.1 AbrB/MazE/SpoVT family DNA-binding domain-containing protein [Desulfovibrio sp.]MDE7241026.1 AbrB/MazE/SpoVT family DNA-binding domain-containing protein [Desulfovibrio sp.]
MLAKLTSKNQLTLPKAIMSQIPHPDYFEVELEDGRIILTPLLLRPADAVRDKLRDLGISEEDVADAIQWSRQG